MQNFRFRGRAFVMKVPKLAFDTARTGDGDGKRPCVIYR